MNPIQQMIVAAIPPDRVVDVVGWAEGNVRLPGSARSESFDASITPWTREPIHRIDDGKTRRVTFVKPIQAGGSVVGEVALCYWAAVKSSGDIQYNWQNDEQAEARWDRRIERILKACPAVQRRWPQERHRATRGQILFPHANLWCQGVLTARRVASDTVTYQINEEVHDEEGWLPGRLDQAFGRTTAVAFPVVLIISNAGRKNSELHTAFLSGTMQRWEVRCPGCGEFHAMRTRWEEKKPELGGLRYDSDGCRLENGEVDYNALAATIRYQFPCGYQVPDDVVIRRQLSLSGRYGEPENKGAPPENRSYTLEAVAVDYIRWVDLIQQKHKALRAMKFGDPEPWAKYLRERECIFADDTERPLVGKIVTSSVKKSRDGLIDKLTRFACIDRQRGEITRGEFPHWWLLIRDFKANGDSLLVYEGKVTDDSELVATVKDHAVAPQCVVVDAGYDQTFVLKFCLQHGFNAIKGDKVAMYRREDGAKRITSEAKPIHTLVNAGPCHEYVYDMHRKEYVPHPLEPLWWQYSKAGIRDRLHYLRASGFVKWEVPEDVSDDYRAHMESESFERRRNARDGSWEGVWVQHTDRNDLFVCECYAAMLADDAGLIGDIAAGSTAVEEKEPERDEEGRRVYHLKS
jgi:hypothetical protein